MDGVGLGKGLTSKNRGTLSPSLWRSRLLSLRKRVIQGGTKRGPRHVIPRRVKLMNTNMYHSQALIELFATRFVIFELCTEMSSNVKSAT